MRNYSMALTTAVTTKEMQPPCKYLKITVGAVDAQMLLRMTPTPRSAADEEDYVTLTANKTYYVRARSNKTIHAILAKTASSTSTLTIVAGNEEFFLDDPTSAVTLGLSSPEADVTTTAIVNEVVGNKADAAATAVGTTKSIMAYIKGAINQLAAIKAKTDNLPAIPAPKPTYTAITIEKTYTDSGDMEAATKAITATTEPAAADYTFTNDLAAPSDNRLVCINCATRLTIVIDSLNDGATTLYVRVKLNTASLFTASFTGTGTKNKAQSNAMTSHTFIAGVPLTVYLWTDAGNIVISKVQLETCYGSASTTSSAVYKIAANGLFSVAGLFARSGSGAITAYIGAPTANAGIGQTVYTASPHQTSFGTPLMMAVNPVDIRLAGTVTDDIVFIGYPGVSTNKYLAVFLMEA